MPDTGTERTSIGVVVVIIIGALVIYGFFENPGLTGGILGGIFGTGLIIFIIATITEVRDG